ncbi:MAG: hypothetical protein LBM17_01495 [Candidatus Accumulibacter sp.]|jgi:hypothetical protein|nr:hypothetical protein [Accumulibacter sp.]
MKHVLMRLVFGVLFVCFNGPAFAGSQDAYVLPEPYISLEKQYLKEFPALQPLMDKMVANSKEILKNPDQDILHNRVCAALAYQMALARKSPAATRKLGPATDLLHNITKDNKKAVLSDPVVLKRVGDLVASLKKAGKFGDSKGFFVDTAILTNKKVADDLSLVHHLTGAVWADDALKEIGGFSDEEKRVIETAIVAHSTGYWYFRDSVDAAAGKDGAWQAVFPQPESDVDKFAHDADLISQFVPESVAPDGSKWRQLATKRWGAKSTKDEGHVVYYVFSRLYDEAKTKEGSDMAMEQWKLIQPDLLRLMDLKSGEDPLKVLGTPAFWKK